MANALPFEDRLRRLRDMSRRLELEEQAARMADVERANHLVDAIVDLNTMITRLEAEAANVSPLAIGSGPAALQPQTKA